MEEFLPVDVSAILGWCNDWPADQWPTISRASYPPEIRCTMVPPYPPGPIRMSGLYDWEWNAFVLYAEPLVMHLMKNFPDCHMEKPWLSACFPGYGVDFHTDQQPDNFVTRIHCPIITNPAARVNVSGEKYYPKVGMSYKIDPRVPHGVKNDGKEIRIHFIFDVMRKE